MIKDRTHGLLTMQMLVMLVLLPLWFMLAVFVAVEIFGKIHYGQITYLIYIMGIMAAAFFNYNAFKRSIPRGPRRFQLVEVIRQTNKDIFVLALVLFGIVFATKDKAISRIFLGTFIIGTWWLLLILNRYLLGWLSRLVFGGESTMNTVLVGSGRTTRSLLDWINHQSPIGIKILGLVTYKEVESRNPFIPIIGEISELENIIREQKVHQVLLLETRYSKEWVNHVTETCLRAGCRLLIYNPWEEYFDHPLKVVTEGEHTFFTTRDEPLENPINRFLKRALDIAVSLPVVFLVLPPLCLLVKLRQNVQSPGPLFHKQERSGIQGRHFNIIKFRTMDQAPPDSADQARQAKPDDERIYPFGKFMRRRSLDEFPQFFNVLLGSMSVVGPRPHLIEHDQEFSRLVDIYRTRHFIKPGITGLAQLKGFRGEITDVEHIRERIRFDLEYIGMWSIWLDIGIIMKTVNQLIVPPRSAY